MGDRQGESVDMLDDFELNQIRLQWLSVRIVWAPILLAQLAFVIVAGIRGPGAAAVDGAAAADTDLPAHLLRYVLCVMSAVVLSLAYLIRRSSANPQSRIHRFIGSYLTCLAVAGALSGSLGLYGLIDFLVEGDYLWFSCIMGASALALAFLRPRKQDLIDMVINSKQNH